MSIKLIKLIFTRCEAILLACLMCLLISSASSAPHQNRTILKYNKIGWYTPSGSLEVWDCTVCQPGYGLSVQCGIIYPFGTKIGCVLCKNLHTFSDTYDINQCQPCAKCQENEIQSGRCKPDKDTTQCHCKPGYYRHHSASCKPCSWCCGDNKTNEQVPECKHLEKKCSFQTAKSCAPTTLPPSTLPLSPTSPASTIKQTRKTESPVNNLSSSATDSNDSESTSNDYQKTQKKLPVKGSKGKMEELPAKIVLSIGGVIVLACLAFGAIFYYLQRSSDPIVDRDPVEDSSRSTSSTSDSTTNVESHVTSPLLDDQGVSNNNDVTEANVDLNTKNGTAKYAKQHETVPLLAFDHKMQARKEARTLPETSGGVSGVNFQRSLTSCTCATTPSIQDNNAHISPTHDADTFPGTSCGDSGVNFQRSLTSCTCETTPSNQDNNAQNFPIELSKEQKLHKQVTDLPLEILNKVRARLDVEDPFFRDYRMLAEKLGVSNDQVRILGQRTSEPTNSLLTEYKLKLNLFMEILKDIKREDVMEIIEPWLNQ